MGLFDRRGVIEIDLGLGGRLVLGTAFGGCSIRMPSAL